MVRNPLRSEAEAFRFLLLTLAAFAAVAVASAAGGPWAALPVWALVSAGAVALYARRGRPRRLLRTAPAHAGPPEERRVLVLAREPLAEATLDEVAHRGDRVLVLSPVSAPPLRHWLSDVDGARDEARRRTEAAAGALREVGVPAAGAVGDEDAVQAVEDALRTFGGDEVVVAGAGGDELAARLRERLALPVSGVA